MPVVVPFRRGEPAPEPVGGGAGAAPPVPLHAAVAAARRRHRNLIAAAGRWALARGVPLPADHVALWAATAGPSGTGRSGDVGGLTGPWYASDLDWFLGVIVADWCAAARCPVPTDLPESLGHLYGFLAETGRLHASSDSLADLRAALAVAARPGHRPAPDPPPLPGPTAA